jgi:hypothetical protein
VAPDPASTEVIGLAALMLASVLASLALALGFPRESVEAISFLAGVVGTWVGLAVYMVGLVTDLY